MRRSSPWCSRWSSAGWLSSSDGAIPAIGATGTSPSQRDRVVATLAQGITLGALLQGIAVEGRAYAGGWWDWLTPFSLLVGVSLVIGYALLGATWLVMKTEGTVQEHCFRLSEKLGIATIACIALVSAATPFLSGAYYERWFSWPQVLFTAQVPAACRDRVRGLAGQPAPPLGVLAISDRAGTVRSGPARTRDQHVPASWFRAP